MPFHDRYRAQVALLLRLLPLIAQEIEVALKGGTAINLFLRDMPRLSVDIDLTYLPIASYDESRTAIDAVLSRIAQRIGKTIAGTQIAPAPSGDDGRATKLTVRAGGVQVKIEVTPVLRGCVYEPEMRAVSPAVEAEFGFAEARLVSFADVYAGKMVAALDRQHPRDLFDVRGLLAREGIDGKLRKAFLVYLLSHHRPMAEVIAPRLKDISTAFLGEFEGMTREPVALEDLYAARTALLQTLIGQMPEIHRRFLVSFERGTPDWTMLDLPHAAQLPAVRWRQRNLDSLSAPNRAKLVAAFETALGLQG